MPAALSINSSMRLAAPLRTDCPTFIAISISTVPIPMPFACDTCVSRHGWQFAATQPRLRLTFLFRHLISYNPPDFDID
jgi:hypothetical protein